MANVLQSAAGEMAVMAIWSIVLAERCSDVVGSKRITFPWALPGLPSAQRSTASKTASCLCSPKATLPLRIHAAHVRFS